MATAEIISIGSEMLLGQTVDTNATWMAQRLTELGVNLFYKTIVGDNPGRMEEVIGRAIKRSDVVITGGGLGPTQDDLTREAIAEVTGRQLILDPSLQEQIQHRFRSRGLIMTNNNERQARIPIGAIAVDNPNGTAPAFIVEHSRGIVFALPGVPFELKWLFDHQVVPYLRNKFDLSEVITYRILKVADLGESRVDDRIGHLIANSNNPTVGVLAHPGQVDVRITAKANSLAEASKLIKPIEDEVRVLLGRHVFATDNRTMEDEVGNLLRQQSISVATYEDLTGGLVAERLQQASAEFFTEGMIGNSSTSICRLLASSGRSNQKDELLDDHKALTEELAWAIRIQAGSDLGLAMHAVTDPDQRVENLARGQTFLSITNGRGFRNRAYASAGQGRPDRTRMSFNALEILRMALLEGIQ